MTSMVYSLLMQDLYGQPYCSIACWALVAGCSEVLVVGCFLHAKGPKPEALNLVVCMCTYMCMCVCIYIYVFVIVIIRIRARIRGIIILEL